MSKSLKLTREKFSWYWVRPSRVSCLALGVALLLAACAGADSPSLDGLTDWIHAKFPRVATITTDELAARFADSDSDRPILLDVRTEEEFAVSHLADARRVEPGAALSESVLELDRATPIVTYCSVGYRSAELAVALSDAGFTHVENLDGSIFQWANEGHPVFRDGRPVLAVHPYNGIWGRYLRADLHADSQKSFPPVLKPKDS